MNIKNEISLDKIKNEILKCHNELGVKVSKIILFGSRARGGYSKYSDWDFLVITEENLSRDEKIEAAHLIRKRLADIYVPCDVLRRSEAEAEKRKSVIGSVIRTALKEGVTI